MRWLAPALTAVCMSGLIQYICIHLLVLPPLQCIILDQAVAKIDTPKIDGNCHAYTVSHFSYSVGLFFQRYLVGRFRIVVFQRRWAKTKEIVLYCHGHKYIQCSGGEGQRKLSEIIRSLENSADMQP